MKLAKTKNNSWLNRGDLFIFQLYLMYWDLHSQYLWVRHKYQNTEAALVTVATLNVWGLFISTQNKKVESEPQKLECKDDDDDIDKQLSVYS